MKKILIFGMIMVISVAMLMTSCKKDKVKKDEDKVLTDAVTDIDGNSYDAVKLGNQVWMAENLRTTRYADGTSIPEGEMPSSGSPFRYAPHGNPSNVSTYGYLYNWQAHFILSNFCDMKWLLLCYTYLEYFSQEADHNDLSKVYFRG